MIGSNFAWLIVIPHVNLRHLGHLGRLDHFSILIYSFFFDFSLFPFSLISPLPWVNRLNLRILLLCLFLNGKV